MSGENCNSPKCRRLTSAAWRRTAEVGSLPRGTLDGSTSCSRCSPTRVTRRHGGCFCACGGRNTSHLQRSSNLLATEPSRLPLGHRPCLSGRRQPSSLGASATGSGSAKSTSPGWRGCAQGCRRGCAAPEPASLAQPMELAPPANRQDRRWPSPSRARSCRPTGPITSFVGGIKTMSPAPGQVSK